MCSQLTMFDVPSQKNETFYVYHDESGTDTAHDRFQFHGALFVPVTKFSSTLDILRSARNGENGRIHFVDLRDKSERLKRAIARKWIDLFAQELSNYCYYKCMLLDMQSEYYIKRTIDDHMIYNCTALNAVYAGIVWFLRGFDNIDLSIFSEEMSRKNSDNFEDYLPRELLKRTTENKKCPKVSLPLQKVTLVNGDPRKVPTDFADHCELIQFTDVLTGAVNQAINARATLQIKTELGRFVAEWIDDTMKSPWLQTRNPHRKFSISCFDGRKFYKSIQLPIKSKDQFILENF